MPTISRTGITSGGTIQPAHITNIIDALDGTSATATVVATGSFSGSFIGQLTGTSSFSTTASYALNAISSGEYMTLRVSCDSITSVTAGTGSTIYVGTNTTSSNIDRVGVMIPFDCTIISSSVYINSPVSTNCALSASLNHRINTTPAVLKTFGTLDPKNVYFDSKAIAVNNSATAGTYINIGFYSNNTATGLFNIAADILIKKS
jgi:hypothetical protein